MERVIVTVKGAHDVRGRDLEVPAEVEAVRLVLLLAQALQWDGTIGGRSVPYTIYAEPPGRVLRPTETLADAGVWDGAQLILQPVGSETKPPPPSVTGPVESVEGPLKGWRGLGIPVPKTHESPSPDGPADESRSGYVWRRLD